MSETKTKNLVIVSLFLLACLSLLAGVGAATDVDFSQPVEINQSCTFGMAQDNHSVLALQLPGLGATDSPEKKHALFLAAKSYAKNNSMQDFQNFYGDREDRFDAELDKTINILQGFMAMHIADGQSPCADASAPCVARFEVLPA